MVGIMLGRVFLTAVAHASDVPSDAGWLGFGKSKKLVFVSKYEESTAIHGGVLRDTGLNLYIRERFTGEVCSFGAMELATPPRNHALLEDQMWISIESMSWKLVTVWEEELSVCRFLLPEHTETAHTQQQCGIHHTRAY